MVKYSYTPKSELIPTASRSGSERSQPALTLEKRKKRKTSANKQADSTTIVEILSEDPGPSASVVERKAQGFDNAISWIEMAREKFDVLGQIVKDVAEVLDITNLRDFDKALGSIPRPRDLAEWNNRIRELQKERALFKAQLTHEESELSVADQKTGEALHLLFQFQAYIGQPGQISTNARVFDETMAKALPMIGAKVNGHQHCGRLQLQDGNTVINMWKLMAGLPPATLQPGTLDLSEFPEILAMEILHVLSTLTKATKTMTSSPSLSAGPGSDVRTRPTEEQLPITSLLEVITQIPEDPPADSPFPTEPAPSNLPPPPSVPTKVISTLPSTPFPRSVVPARLLILPSPQVTILPSLPAPTVPLTQPSQRNLPSAQGRGRGFKNKPMPGSGVLL